MTTEVNHRGAGIPAARKPLGAKSLAAPELWAAIPRHQLQAMIRPMVGRMVRDMINEIREGVPAYRQPLQGKFGQVLVTSVERSVLHVVDNINNPNVDTTAWEEWFRYAGKLEFHEGRTMDALQNAVRIGAKVAWRHTRAAGVAAGLPSSTLFAIADAIFAYTDELCLVAIAGFTDAQARASGSRERRRQQLLKQIISEQPQSRQSLVDLAASAAWDLPEQVAVALVEHTENGHESLDASLDDDVLVDLESAEPRLVVGDPDKQLHRLGEQLDGRKAVVGPLVPITDAYRSLTSARRAMELVQRGVLPAADITWCSEHLSTLALLSDEFLISQLVDRALQPFANLTVKQRERLSATLLAWLGTRGGINEIANRLDVHPQTVRYRMHQINELLGDRLDDPEQRLIMEIALRAQKLLGAAPKSARNGSKRS